jgi:general secretion pathway protein G
MKPVRDRRIRPSPRAERPRLREGFSLLELVVVLSIVAALSGIAAPVVAAAVTRFRVEETRKELKALVPAVQNCFWDCKRFPTALAQLETNSQAVAGWSGPYATALLAGRAAGELSLDRDAWGRAYLLSFPTASSMEIRSVGPDGSAGTGDDLVQVADVTLLRRKETADELDVLNAAIRAYNARHLAAAPLPGDDLDGLLESLYAAGLLARPAPGASDPLRADGWGDAYVALPEDVTPCVRLTSIHVSGDAAPPSGGS